jgi:hypothetical protein
MEPWIIPVIVAIALALAVYFSYRWEKKRREALAALAEELRWRFDPSNDRDHDDEYANFAVFRRGHSRVAFNTLYGTQEIDDRVYQVKMGDFRYRVREGSGKSKRTRTYKFSYLILHMPFADLPKLLIRRERVFDKLAGAFGFDDIDFESHEFSKRYYVKSDDKRFAYAVVHPRMMEYLLETNPPAIDIEGGCYCVTDGRRRWQPAEFKSQLDWARRFFDLWPDFLTTELDSSKG